MLPAIASICSVYFMAVYEIGFVDAKISYATYSSSIKRVTPYKPYVIAKTCFLKPDKGPCRAEISMYYFEPEHKNCTTFSWGGCQGNGNRFDTKQECTKTCLSKPNHPKGKAKYCSLTFDYGFCFGAIKRWYYDPLWKVCKQRIYSGCGGNKNNFYDQAQCDSICRFGTGILKPKVKGKGEMKKILVINSVNATTRKSRQQARGVKSPDKAF